MHLQQLVNTLQTKFNVVYNQCDIFLIFFFYIKACSSGTYGNNCSSRCGKCRDMEQCHHINGTCMTGCDSGYQGFKCTAGSYI